MTGHGPTDRRQGSAREQWPDPEYAADDHILIALTARQIGATVVTSNLLEFRRIASKIPGLKVVAP